LFFTLAEKIYSVNYLSLKKSRHFCSVIRRGHVYIHLLKNNERIISPFLVDKDTIIHLRIFIHSSAILIPSSLNSSILFII